MVRSGFMDGIRFGRVCCSSALGRCVIGQFSGLENTGLGKELGCG